MILRLLLTALVSILAACSTSGGDGGDSKQNDRSDNLNEILGYSLTLQPGSFDCADATVHCVDDDATPEREFADIQAAVDVAGPGDVVLVHDGSYVGFRVDNAGIQGDEILVTANGNDVNITGPGGRSGDDNIYVANSDYVIIEGFTVTGAVKYGIATHDATSDSPMRGVQFRYNTVSGSGSTNIYLSQGSSSLVLANTTFGSLGSHGIYISNSGADDVAVIGNRSYQNDVAGIHFNGDASVPGGDGLQTGHIVAANIVYQNNSNGINCDGVQDSLFVNNLVYDNGNHGIRVYRIDASDGAANLSFINNTVVDNQQMAIKLSDDSGGNLFFNNILVDNANGCISVESTNIVSDNNIFTDSCFFEPANSSLFFGAASQTASSAQLFNDAAAGDFRPSATSPAVNNGVSTLNGTEAPIIDVEGKDRDSDTDIGAFEF